MRWKNLELYLRQSLIGNLIPGAADVRIVTPRGTGQPSAYWESQGMWDPGKLYKTITTAYGECTSGRNDVILISPDSHGQVGTALTLSKNMTHLIGMSPSDAMMGMRSRIGHSTTIASFLTVSGYGNLLANLYFQYGVANTDLNLLNITGNNNSFKRCHFLPTYATALDSASFALVKSTAGNMRFKECVFGSLSTAQSEGTLFQFNGTTEPSISIFDDCLFFMVSDHANPTFMDVGVGAGTGVGVFRNCQFLNIGGTALTYGIDGAGLNNFQLFFDNRCSFAGCTDVVAAGYEAKVWFGGVNMPINQVNTASVALFNGIACHPDVS